MKSIQGIKFSSLLIAFLILTVTVSCNKDDDCRGCGCSFPATTEGANTISCLVNGKPWSSCAGKGNSLGGSSKAAINFSWNTAHGWNVMTFAGNQFADGRDNALEITLNPPTEELLTTYYERRFRLFLGRMSEHNFGVNAQYKLDTTKPWQVDVLRFDKENRIISGTFFGTVKLTIGSPTWDGKLLEITEGQFDINF